MKLGLVPIDVGVPNVGAMVALVQKAEAVGLESVSSPTRPSANDWMLRKWKRGP